MHEPVKRTGIDGDLDIIEVESPERAIPDKRDLMPLVVRRQGNIAYEVFCEAAAVR